MTYSVLLKYIRLVKQAIPCKTVYLLKQASEQTHEQSSPACYLNKNTQLLNISHD